ncbi:MAG TPA: hypothetical protein VNO81_03175 [Candidatus Nitrosotenuis sp.]|nr:hypothetical protein [Candidatus Nitrosotenuis sp.]
MVARTCRRPSGLNLNTVFLIVAVMATLAMTMTSLFMTGLNFTNGFLNGDLALNEAEAGLSELLWKLSEDERWGEERDVFLRSTATPDASEQEAWHMVTFRRGDGVPWSTNNYQGTASDGYGGRTVPTRFVHAYSVGYFRGQYRVVEALIEDPPYPIALGCSGRVTSLSPLDVRGTTETSAYMAGEEDRPGHVLCNSPEGVRIQRGDASSEVRTFISGFVKAVGPVSIEPPATVKGGVRPYADTSTLPSFDITSYRNAGEPGVINIVDSTLSSQNLDVMYYCSHDLTCEGSVVLDNAFLYVDGALTIKGCLSGRGAVVVNGPVTIERDTALMGTNRVALLAAGDVTLRGQGNFFQGFVYSEGDLDARNIKVLGSLVVNSDSPEKGNSVLDRVTVISNQETGEIRFTASSSSDAQTQVDNGTQSELPFPFPMSPEWDDETPIYVGRDGNPHDDGGRWGWKASPEDVDFAVQKLTQDETFIGNVVLGAALRMGEQAQTYQERVAEIAELEARIARLEAEIREAEEEDPPEDTSRQEAELDAAQRRLEQAKIEKQQAFEDYKRAVADLGEEYKKYYRTHSKPGGSYKDEGKTIDVFVDYKFSLNEFIPLSERLKVRYWHLYHRLP